MSGLFSYFIGVCFFAGLVLSLIIVQYYIQKSTGLISKWCSTKTDSQDSCSSVLDSRFAKTFGISHADIGVVYFGGLFSSILILQEVSIIIFWLSILTILYTGFSLYVQKYILQMICIACCLVQLVIIVQACISIIFFGDDVFLPLTSKNAINLILIFLLISMLWLFLRFMWRKYTQDKIQDHSFLSNANIAYFRKQKGKLSFEKLEGDIVLDVGSSHVNEVKKNDPWQVVVGIAPSCHHCGEFLDEFLKLLKENPLPVELTVRFVVLSFDEEQDAINDQIVTETLIALSQIENHQNVIAHLQRWYSEYSPNNLKAWLASVPEIEDQERNLAGIFMADATIWFDSLEAEHTPVVLLEQIPIEVKNVICVPELLKNLSE